MGFYLLHESMLQSVLAARDRWLRPGGVMLPSRATILAAPVSLSAFRRRKIDFWDDVHGFDMTALKPHAWEAATAAPLVRSLRRALPPRVTDGGGPLHTPGRRVSKSCRSVQRPACISIDSASLSAQLHLAVPPNVLSLAVSPTPSIDGVPLR
jgi:hypothetical protein